MCVLFRLGAGGANSSLQEVDQWREPLLVYERRPD